MGNVGIDATSSPLYKGRMTWICPIPTFPNYAADRLGNIWSYQPGRHGKEPMVLSPWQDKRGYLHVTLRLGERGKDRKRVQVHTLVFLAFHGAVPDGCVVTHENGRPDDNRPSNLFAATQAENIAHKWDHGTMVCGERSHLTRVTDADCYNILAEMEAGYPRQEIAARYGVTVNQIYALRSGRIRKHLRADHAKFEAGIADAKARLDAAVRGRAAAKVQAALADKRATLLAEAGRCKSEVA